MRLSMLATSLLMISMTASAGDPVDLSLAMEYLTMSRTEEVLNASVSEYDEQLFKNAPPEDRIKLRQLLEDSIGWDATKDQLADLVIILYTREEMESSIAFMKSDVGASFTAKNAEFSKLYTNVIVSNLQKVLLKCCSQTK